MILRGRNSSGGPTPWRLALVPLSGIISNSVIFGTHSTNCSGTDCDMGPAHDAPLFNDKFWDSNDVRIKVPSTDLPPGIERYVASNGERRYFIAPQANLRTRMLLDFCRTSCE